MPGRTGRGADAGRRPGAAGARAEAEGAGANAGLRREERRRGHERPGAARRGGRAGVGAGRQPRGARGPNGRRADTQ
eukprot:15481322-Alexandrium_andersonii.AAC.1